MKYSGREIHTTLQIAWLWFWEWSLKEQFSRGKILNHGAVLQTPCISEGICLPAEDSEVNGMSHPNAVDRIYQERTVLAHCSVKRPVTLPLRVLPLKKLVQLKLRTEKNL